MIQWNGLCHISTATGLEPLELEEALAAESKRLADAEVVLKRGEVHKSHQQHSYLSRSRYEHQLFRFEKLFSSEQLMVLRSEDLFGQPQRIWEQVLVFLDLDDHPLPSSVSRYAGAGERAVVTSDQYQLLRNQLEPTFHWLEQQ